MRKIIAALVLFTSILILGISGCDQNVGDIEKPELNIDGIGGYAGKVHYITVKKAGLKCILYYSVTENTFNGFLENTNKKDFENISIRISDKDGNIITQTSVGMIEGNSAMEIDEMKELADFDVWMGDLVLEGKKDEEEKVVIIGDRVKNGVLVSFDHIMLKEYEEFVVRKNQGTNYRGYQYAGRHQKYILKEGNLVVEISYDYSTSTFNGTVLNMGKISKGMFGIHILFNTGERTEEYVFNQLGSLSSGDFGFNQVRWKEFEIYRPVIKYYGSYVEPDLKTSVEIKDIF